MAKLIYSAITSLDGYVSDTQGRFDWAAPDEEVHSFVNELSRPIGAYLFGRRMYEVMTFWEGDELLTDAPKPIAEFAAIWRAADKVVYSRTLEAVATKRTRIERSFDPPEVARLKASAERDLAIGGAELAGQALRAGLVDELWLVVAPIVVGGGHSALPDDLTQPLELVDERRFGNGMVYLAYRVGRP